jgi:peptidoglycan/LPS O-acetylase OafA/YrhL
MSETVLNAVGTSAPATAMAQQKGVNMKWFPWLYILIGLAILIVGPATMYQEGGWSTTDYGIVAVIGILVTAVGFMDFRNIRSMANKPIFAAILIILGIILLPLFTYYGAFNGLLGNDYNLSGLSMGGFLLIFAGLGEIYLLRKKPMHM